MYKVFIVGVTKKGDINPKDVELEARFEEYSAANKYFECLGKVLEAKGFGCFVIHRISNEYAMADYTKSTLFRKVSKVVVMSKYCEK